jgi:hypothetical protein
MTRTVEQHAENEVFMGNCKITMGRPHLATLKTLRLGSVAYDIHGAPLPDSLGYAPMFVDRAELAEYDRIMMTRAFGPNYR